jgi:hypothetical protein
MHLVSLFKHAKFSGRQSTFGLQARQSFMNFKVHTYDKKIKELDDTKIHRLVLLQQLRQQDVVNE